MLTRVAIENWCGWSRLKCSENSEIDGSIDRSIDCDVNKRGEENRRKRLVSEKHAECVKTERKSQGWIEKCSVGSGKDREKELSQPSQFLVNVTTISTMGIINESGWWIYRFYCFFAMTSDNCSGICTICHGFWSFCVIFSCPWRCWCVVAVVLRCLLSSSAACAKIVIFSLVELELVHSMRLHCRIRPLLWRCSLHHQSHPNRRCRRRRHHRRRHCQCYCQNNGYPRLDY